MSINLSFLRKMIQILDKFEKTLYNAKGMRVNLCMESISIETYESCQVRKEAAISSHLYVRYFP